MQHSEQHSDRHKRERAEDLQEPGELFDENGCQNVL